MIKKTITWTAITTFLIVLFYYLIPVNIYQSFTTFIALTGSITIGISASLFSICLISLIKGHKIGDKTEPGSEGYVVFAVFMICLFGGGFLLILRETSLVRTELDKNGVFVVAKVINGDSFSTRKLDMTKIRVIFKMENGLNTTQNISISKTEFGRYYLNQEIPILYSSKYPSIIELLRTDQEVYKYLNLGRER